MRDDLRPDDPRTSRSVAAAGDQLRDPAAGVRDHSHAADDGSPTLTTLSQVPEVESPSAVRRLAHGTRIEPSVGLPDRTLLELIAYG